MGGKGLGRQLLKYLLLTDDVVGIVTNAEDEHPVWYESVKPLAEENNIPYFTQNINDLEKELTKLQPDFIICHGYDTILKPKIINLVAVSHAINLHTGLIDQYRGRYPTVFPILHGAKEAGVTIHEMLPEVDAGGVYAQAKVFVEDTDTAETLYYKCVGAGFAVFRMIWDRIKDGEETLYKLDLSNSKLITKKDFPSLEIDLSWHVDKVERMVRALTFAPFPKPFFVVAGRKYEINYNGGKYESTSL